MPSRQSRRVLPERPDICISTGLAGALRSRYRPGDISAARLVSEVGERGGRGETIPTARAAAADRGAPQIERFVTSPELAPLHARKRSAILEARRKQSKWKAIRFWRKQPGMECRRWPFEPIGDTVDFDMPYDFERARDVRGQIHFGGIVTQALRRPSGLLALPAPSGTTAALLPGNSLISWMLIRECSVTG